MDKFRIDGHKLIYHVSRVSDWMAGKDTYPIYMEISPTGSCNHRCVYCALDFMGYKPMFLEKNILKRRLLEMGKLGVKSIMYAGEGEPFLHKDMIEIIRFTKDVGIDAAVTTNAVLFNKNIADNSLPYLSWLKASISAGTANTYSRIHRTRPEDFNKSIENLSNADKVRKGNDYKCTLGVQIILLPENYKEIITLVKIVKNIGMDYLVIKPYSQHPLSITTKYKDIRYRKYFDLKNRLDKFNDDDFQVIFRINAMRKWEEVERNYKHCLALPFWSYIDSMGGVWSCSMYLTKNKFFLGNIYKDTFTQILKNKKRRNLIKYCREKLDTNRCRINCRMDEINRYLWELEHPPAHVNFI